MLLNLASSYRQHMLQEGEEILPQNYREMDIFRVQLFLKLALRVSDPLAEIIFQLERTDDGYHGQYQVTLSKELAVQDQLQDIVKQAEEKIFLYPLMTVHDNEYPEIWLQKIFPHLSNVITINDVLYTELDVEDDEHIAAYDEKVLHVLEEIREYYQNGVIALSAEEARKWHCVPYKDGLYRMQRPICHPISFLLNRLQGRDFLFYVGANKVVKATVAKFLQHRQIVIYYRDYLAIKISSGCDYDLIDEVREIMFGANGYMIEGSEISYWELTDAGHVQIQCNIST